MSVSRWAEWFQDIRKVFFPQSALVSCAWIFVDKGSTSNIQDPQNMHNNGLRASSWLLYISKGCGWSVRATADFQQRYLSVETGSVKQAGHNVCVVAFWTEQLAHCHSQTFVVNTCDDGEMWSHVSYVLQAFCFCYTLFIVLLTSVCHPCSVQSGYVALDNKSLWGGSPLVSAVKI